MSKIQTFTVAPDRSALLVETRSNVGPIVFGSLSVEGEAELSVASSAIDSAVVLSAVIRVPVGSLESGNSLYDSELRNRLDQRRFPAITVALTQARSLGDGRFDAEGDLTIHGTTQRLTGSLAVTMPDEKTVIAEGRHVVDIRDFAISLPTMLMLKIYPDVSVQFRITAVRA
ncbi:YceI family protein [Sporichthya sp.]|uniref:YceI family protein n=1 Tax=Sporichthya sp. TaxID=65475 RepID=UPI0017DC0E3B|nr:YceI family protein [Sporichthya sp.]MBA3741332.1 YceI family protein [Sporichthya sp.]